MKNVNLKDLGMAMKFLIQAMKSKNNSSNDTKERSSSHRGSKKGYSHRHNPTFKSRQISPVTPAQYRRLHLGRTTFRYEASHGS